MKLICVITRGEYRFVINAETITEIYYDFTASSVRDNSYIYDVIVHYTNSDTTCVASYTTKREADKLIEQLSKIAERPEGRYCIETDFDYLSEEIKQRNEKQ